MATVLLVEDDHVVRGALLRSLTDLGHTVYAVGTALEALRKVASDAPDCVVLDLGLPDLDGADALRMIRGVSDAPVIIATARDDEAEIVRLLKAGADDYMVKPFALEELVARLHALLRRSDNLLGHCLTLGNVALDTEGRQVTVNGTVRHFSSRETAVLEILLRRCGNVAPKRLFEDHLFGLSDEVGSNAVEVYIHRLRRMLADSGATVQVHTVRGVGYMLAEAKAG